MQTGSGLALHSLTLWTLYRVFAAQLSVTAQCGEDVTLSCTFPPLGLAASQQVNITWKMQRAEGADLLVHSYCSGRETQAQAYKWRTQLDPEGISKGNASLRLRDVHIQDEGSYSCYVNSELGSWSEETSLTVLSPRSVGFYFMPLLHSLMVMVIIIIIIIIIEKHRLPIQLKLRPYFAFEAKRRDGCLSGGSEDKNNDVEGRLLPEAHLLWNLRVDDYKRNPVLQAWQLPAWNERHAWEKSKQQSFFQGSPAWGKLPINMAWNPRRKGHKLSSDGESTDFWSNKFTSEAGHLSVVDSAWQEDARLSQKRMCHVAILGQTSSGKSSFINAIRDLGDEEEGAAKTGVVETTMVPTPYRLPKHPNVILWELPGFGRTKRQPEMDLDLISVSWCNVFLIFSSHHFTAEHASLAQKIQRVGKKVYFVRTKVDRELLAARKRRPSTYNEEQILQRIRDTCVKSLQREGVASPQVFLLSNFECSSHDFLALEKILQQEFDSHFPG